MCQGICLWCFEPVWKDNNSRRMDDHIYHNNCSYQVEKWQKENNKNWIEQIMVNNRKKA